MRNRSRLSPSRQGGQRLPESGEQRRSIAGDVHRFVAALGATTSARSRRGSRHSRASNRNSASFARLSTGGAVTDTFNTGHASRIVEDAVDAVGGSAGGQSNRDAEAIQRRGNQTASQDNTGVRFL